MPEKRFFRSGLNVFFAHGFLRRVTPVLRGEPLQPAAV